MREKVSVKGRHITTRIEPRLTIDFFPLSDVIIPKSKVTEPPPKDMDDNAAEDDDDDDDDEDDDDDDDIFYDSEDGQDVEGSADSTL